MTTTESTARLTYREMRTRAQEVADERIKEGVLKGLELLNEKYGDDWVDHITPEALDLRSATACVLGQVYEHESDGSGYHHGLRVLGIEDEPEQYGFSTENSWTKLQEAWLHVFTNE